MLPGPLARRARAELRASQGLKGPKVSKARRVIRDRREGQGTQGHRDSQGTSGLRDQRETVEALDRLGTRELPGRREPRDLPGLKARRAQLGRQVSGD